MVQYEKIALGDLFDIGSSKRVFQSEWRKTGIPFYRAREIAKLSADGYVDNELFIDQALYEKYIKEYGKPESGDIMVTGVGTLGVCYVVQEHDEFYFKDGNILWFRQKNKERVIPEYVVKAFDSNYVKEEIRKNSSGTTVGTFTIQTANRLAIPLPDIKEQQIIVNELSAAEKLIFLRKQQLAKLDELVKARFVELFGDPVKNDMGWESKPLNEVCDGIGDGLHGTPVYDDGGDYPFINGNNLIDGKIVITPATKMVSEETYMKHFIDISTNAILISINGTLGKLAFYKGEKVMLGKSACYCNLKQNINKVFVYGVMKSDSFAEFLDNSSTKSTIKNVGLKAMREYKLILPPTELQEQFTAFVEQTDKSKLAIQQSLDKLETLKKALMQKYFG